MSRTPSSAPTTRSQIHCDDIFLTSNKQSALKAFFTHQVPVGYNEMTGIYRGKTFACGMWEFNESENVKNKQKVYHEVLYQAPHPPPPPLQLGRMSPEILSIFLSSPFHIKHTTFDVEYVELPCLASSPFTFQNKKCEPHSCSLLFLSVRVSPHGRPGAMAVYQRPAVAYSFQKVIRTTEW
jgi:hypothetical protein